MKLACILGLIVWLCAIPLFATENSNESDTWLTHFQTPNPYQNKARYDVILGVKDANELIVRMRGETEKEFDYIYIYDSNGEEIKQLSGTLGKNKNEIVSFNTLGDHIRVVFVADGRTSKSGFAIDVEARSPVLLFDDIKRQLLAVIEHILRQGTKTAQNQLSGPLNELKALNTTIQKAQKLADIMPKVSILLSKVANAYQNIAAQQPKLAEDHQIQFQNLQALMNKTLVLRDNTAKRKNDYIDKLNSAKNQLVGIDDDLERQKIQFSIMGYEVIVNALETQESFWYALYETQQTLSIKLDAHSKKVMVLLHYLRINAQVNQQMADVASLKHNSPLNESTLAILRNLSDLSELRQIIHDIETSERELRTLENNIEQTNFGS